MIFIGFVIAAALDPVKAGLAAFSLWGAWSPNYALSARLGLLALFGGLFFSMEEAILVSFRGTLPREMADTAVFASFTATVVWTAILLPFFEIRL